MIVSLIVARASNGAIGKDNQLLWHLSEDLQFFKRTTMGCPIIMGRNTYESIGRLLPGRENVILSRQVKQGYAVPGASMASSLEEALESLQGKHEKVFIIGGGKLYAEALEKKVIQEMFITQVESEFEGDAFFTFQEDNWKKVWQENKLDEKSGLEYSFQEWQPNQD